MTTDDGICSGCRFWNPIPSLINDVWKEGFWGECRRRSPRAMLFGDSDPSVQTIEQVVRWPVTYDDYWCGEWEAKR